MRLPLTILPVDFRDNLSPGLWRKLYDVPPYQKFFRTAEETKWKYVLPVTIQGVVAHALRKSYISALPEIEQNKAADSLRNILETQQKRWVNKEEGVFKYPYETTVMTMRRK